MLEAWRGGAMSIQVVCQNGHVLKVKDEFAGKQGLCPMCKVPIAVPKPASSTMSEDAILGLLESEPAAGVLSRQTASDSPPLGRSNPVGLSARPMVAGRKLCHKCHEPVPGSIHICPNCHAYVANLGDF
jgi:hypothetical protein